MITLEKIYEAMVFEDHTDDCNELDELVKQLKALSSDKLVSIILRDLEEFRWASFSKGVKAQKEKKKVYTEAEVLAIIANVKSRVWEECGKTRKAQTRSDSKHAIMDMTGNIAMYLAELHFNVIEGWHPEFNHPQEIEELYI